MYGIARILAALTKKTFEAVRAPTYALQEKERRKKKKEKGFVVLRLTHCCFF